MLIASAFPGELDSNPGLVFETFYATWLMRLLDTRLCRSGSKSTKSLADHWSGDLPPCGFLVRYDPDEERATLYDSPDAVLEYASGETKLWHDESKSGWRDLCRFASPPLQGTFFLAAPTHMSSGFHQLAPIIVQAGLMAANDILCVENPEVHLHPKLQLDIAEFFVRQASIGKYMILETHSDLVVRRVMRAVLSEELRQEAVRLYFARVHWESKHMGNTLDWINRETSEVWPRPVAYSVLETVQIDKRGRIRNWPDGFLDADILESRRLIDVMYGSPLDDRDMDEDQEVSS